MTDIVIKKKNEVYVTVKGAPHVHHELSDYFSFEVPEAKFLKRNPRYKYWDGMIRLYSPGTGELYGGLLDHLQEWAHERAYTVGFETNDWYGEVEESNDFVSYEGVKVFMDKIASVKPREYQYKAVYEALKNNRKLLLSPTGSGKSLMIYSLVRYYTATDKKTLIIVPTTSLVEQMVNDFKEYGWNADAHVHKIYSGKDKNTDKEVIISTWQSIYKFPKRYFCLLYTSPSPRDRTRSRMPSSA